MKTKTKTKLQNNLKRPQSQSQPNVLISSSNTKREIYTKAMPSTSSPKLSLLKRMEPLSLLERLSSPISQCSTTGTVSAPLAMSTGVMKRAKIIDNDTSVAIIFI